MYATNVGLWSISPFIDRKIIYVDSIKWINKYPHVSKSSFKSNTTHKGHYVERKFFVFCLAHNFAHEICEYLSHALGIVSYLNLNVI